jgi:hypothetical protein
VAGNKDGIIGVYITYITIFKIDFQHVMEPNIWLSKVLKYKKRRGGDVRVRLSAILQKARHCLARRVNR